MSSFNWVEFFRQHKDIKTIYARCITSHNCLWRGQIYLLDCEHRTANNSMAVIDRYDSLNKYTCNAFEPYIPRKDEIYYLGDKEFTSMGDEKEWDPDRIPQQYHVPEVAARFFPIKSGRCIICRNWRQICAEAVCEMCSSRLHAPKYATEEKKGKAVVAKFNDLMGAT